MTKVDAVKEEKVKVESMEELVAEAGDDLVPFKVGEVSEVTVSAVTKGCIWVDVAGVAVGIIPDREFSYGVNELKPGDKIPAYVLALEDKEGHVVLSLRRADRERLWVTLKDKFESGEVVQAKAVEANKGGLMVEVGGVVGFLPISQLASSHYPRQSGGNRDDIVGKLNDLINETLNVKIISFDKVTNKLIFSEKAAGDTAIEEKLSKIVVGGTLKGRITGIVDFGLFVDIGDGVEGLVHISEVSWQRVSDLRTLFSVGDEINVSVTGIADGKVSLSIKRLSDDPWVKSTADMKVGDKVDGTITRITPFGAFVKINDSLDGLVHISEISNERIEDPGAVLKVGEKKKFRIISIENQSHRISLSLKDVENDKVKSTEKETPAKVAEVAEEKIEVAPKAEKETKTVKAKKVKAEVKDVEAEAKPKKAKKAEEKAK